MRQSTTSWLQKVRYSANLGTIYILTIAFAWYAFHPHTTFKAVSITKADQQPHVTLNRPAANEISGLPVRIVIPGSSYNGQVVNLPIDPGYYDASSNSWTLSGRHAQFAMLSNLANNIGGDTYIYGHNNDYVFGALRHVTPTVGATALIYTSNGHVFSYTFASATNVAPDITSVLRYKGPPILTIQTCTGSLNEVRTLYRYSFNKVLQ